MKPKLYVNTALIEEPYLVSDALTGVDGYSITPTTFESRSFWSNINDTCYTDRYEYGGNGVTRYGINVSKIEVNMDTKQIDGMPTEMLDCQHGITISSGSSKYTRDDAAQVELHRLEIELLQRAIDTLLSSNNNAVLVDIFARNKGAVKILAGNKCETHTVILYKNPSKVDGTHDVLVIDPSNFLFSSHLSNSNVLLYHKALDHVVTLHRGMQIYIPDSKNVGPNNGQYRDCIDIAAKLAIGLQQVCVGINLEKIDALDIVKAISNNKDIDGNVVGAGSTRVKQTSDLKVVHAFYEAGKNASITQKLTAILFPISEENVRLAYKNIIATSGDGKLVIQEIIEHNAFWMHPILETLKTMQETLIGLYEGVKDEN